MPRNGARVLPFEVVAVPEHGAQIFARAPTKSYVQTSARAREESRFVSPKASRLAFSPGVGHIIDFVFC